MSKGKLEHEILFCTQTVGYTIQYVAWRYVRWCGAGTAAYIGTVCHVEKNIGEHFCVLDEPAEIKHLVISGHWLF
jgi:hypothetical protein